MPTIHSNSFPPEHRRPRTIVGRAGRSLLLFGAVLLISLPAAAQSFANIRGPSEQINSLPLAETDWLITVSHVTGAGTLTDLDATITLPSGWYYVGVQGSCAGTVSGTGPVTWQFDELAPGGTEQCTLIVAPQAQSAGQTQGHADLTYQDGATTRPGSGSTTFFVFSAIDLVVTIDVLEAELAPEESGTLQITVQNFGNATISGPDQDIRVVLDLGPFARTGGTCFTQGGDVVFGPLGVVPEDVHQCNVQIEAPAGAPGEIVTITAQGSTTSSLPETLPGDEDDEDVVRLAAPLDLTVDVATDGTDTNPGDGICATVLGDCTLRAAIVESNAWPEEDEIRVPSTADYELTAFLGNDDEDVGDLDIRDSVTIIGGPPEGARGGFPNQTTIAGLDNAEFSITSRVFEIPDELGVVATLRDLILRDGEDTEGGGMRVGPGNELILDNVTFEDNRSSGDGGGLWSRSSVTGTDVDWIDNFASGNGAGVDWTAEGGVLDLLRARFESNRTNFGASNAGGGLQLGSEAGGPKAYIRDSTFFHNRAHNGGGINTGVQTWITNTTISSNEAVSSGGGIRAGLNTVRLAYSTVVFNDAGLDSGQQWTSSSGTGGGIFVNPGLAAVRLYHSVVSGNRARLQGSPISVPRSAECSGSMTSDGVAVVQYVALDTECSLVGAAGDLINTNPLLSALNESSGLHGFGTDSPLLDLGETSCFWDDDGDLNYDAPLLTDQDGNARPLDGDGDHVARCDAGAYERRLILPESHIFSDGFESGNLIGWN